MDERVLVIGLDGFETTIADRLVGEGRMPHYARAQERAACMALDHGSAKRTGLAWEHFSTGLSPQGAERWSAVQFDGRRYRCTQQPTQLLPFPARCNIDTVVFDVPYFDLARAGNVRGMVSWGAHDPGTQQFSRPNTLTDEITARFGAYPAQPWIYGFTWPSVSRTVEMGVALTKATRLRADITQWLLGERLPDWSLGVVVVSELHSAIEALWHGVDSSHPLHGLPSAAAAREGLESVYEAVDELIGALLERFPNCLHLICSMHGMGPNTADVAAMALLPELLYRHACGAQLLDTSAGDPIEHLCSTGATSWTPHVRERWLGGDPAARNGGRVQSMISRAAKHLPALGGVSEETSLSWMPAAWYAPYWRSMPAFALPAFYDGQIRLNVRDREQHGRVAPSDYDAVCEDIGALLEGCIDPATGAPVVQQIVHTHPGDPLALNPTEADMIVVWRGAPRAFVTADHGTIGPLAPRRSGGHTGGHGISLWVGSGLEVGHHGQRSAFDVVPTLLDVLGTPSSGQVDGQSFLDVIRSGAGD